MSGFINTDMIERIAGLWGGWMWPMSWQTGLMAAAVFAVALAARKASPKFRYFLWCLVLLKLCLPPTLTLGTGIGQWLLPQQSAAAPAEYTAAPTAHMVVLLPAVNNYTQSELPLIEATPEPLPPYVPSTGLILMTIWLSGIAALTVIFLVQYRRVIRLLKSGKQVEDENILRLLEEARAALGLKTPVPILSVPKLDSPILFGLLRPHIAIPSHALEKLPLEQLRPIILHELAHYRRRDVWQGAFQMLLQTLYWFHPAVWLANGQLRRERELIVDDLVLARMRDARDVYGASLLSILRHGAQKRFLTPGYVGIVETGGALTHRLKRILDKKRAISLRMGWIGAVALVLLGLVLVPQARSDADEEPAKAPGEVEIELVEGPPNHEAPAWAADAEDPPNPTLPQSQIQVEVRIVSGEKDTELVQYAEPAFISDQETAELIHRVKNSRKMTVMSAPHVTAVSGVTQCVSLAQEGTYASGYAKNEQGIWVPTIDKYAVSKVTFYFKGDADERDAAVQHFSAIMMSGALIPCTTELNVPDGKGGLKRVETNVSEVIESTLQADNDEFRLKPGQSLILPTTLSLKRYVSNVRKMDIGSFKAEDPPEKLVKDDSRTIVILTAKVLLPEEVAVNGGEVRKTEAPESSPALPVQTGPVKEADLLIHQYDVADLLMAPWKEPVLLNLLAQLTGPSNWDCTIIFNSNNAQMNPAEKTQRLMLLRRGYLMVQHNDEMHKAIEGILARLRTASRTPFIQKSLPGVVAGGVLTADANKPVPKAEVLVFHVQSFNGFILKTKEDGTFKLSGLPTGRYFLMLDAPGYELAPANGGRSAGPITVLEITQEQPQQEFLFSVRPVSGG